MYAGFGDASIVKYDVSTWEPTAFASGHSFTVYVLLFAKGAPLVGERQSTPMVSGAGDGEMRVLDAASCSLVQSLRGHNAAVKALAVVHGALRRGTAWPLRAAVSPPSASRWRWRERVLRRPARLKRPFSHLSIRASPVASCRLIFRRQVHRSARPCC